MFSLLPLWIRLEAGYAAHLVSSSRTGLAASLRAAGHETSARVTWFAGAKSVVARASVQCAPILAFEAVRTHSLSVSRYASTARSYKRCASESGRGRGQSRRVASRLEFLVFGALSLSLSHNDRGRMKESQVFEVAKPGDAGQVGEYVLVSPA